MHKNNGGDTLHLVLTIANMARRPRDVCGGRDQAAVSQTGSRCIFPPAMQRL